MTLPERVVLVGVCLLCAAAPAAGQRVVAYHYPDGAFTVPVTESFNVATGQSEWTQRGAESPIGLFTSDGRFMVSATATTPPSLRVFDVTSRASVVVPLDFAPRVAHPRRLEVLGLATYRPGQPGGDAAILSLAGLRSLGACSPGATTDVDFSANGSVVLALCGNGDVVVIETDTGSIRRTVSAGAGAGLVRLVRSNHDGSRALVTRDPFLSTGVIALVDTMTGASLGTTTFPQPNPFGSGSTCTAGNSIVASPDRRSVLVGCGWVSQGPGTFYAFSTRWLDVESLAWGADPQIPYGLMSAAISPDGRTVFAHSQNPRGGGPAQLIDIGTNATVVRLEGVAGLSVSFPPLAPTLLSVVSGRRIDLSWTSIAHSPMATRHVLDVGTAPGLTNLGSIAVGPEEALTVPSAPPGRYYVRVRAANIAGTSAPSNEIVIDVP